MWCKTFVYHFSKTKLILKIMNIQHQYLTLVPIDEKYKEVLKKYEEILRKNQYIIKFKK